MALQIEGIHHSFGRKKNKVHVLDDVSLSVPHQQFVSLVGPSGSGKSTLFHMIGGLIHPDGGMIWLDGQEAIGKRGQISYMPQQPALFPWRTIEENVILPQELIDEPKKTALSEARSWLKQVGLAGYEKSYPRQLSGGMQQRVAFLRALLSRQELICLDEPFSALDALTRLDMQKWLLQIWEQNKRSVLLVTHNIEEALLLSDIVYVLSAKPAKILRKIKVDAPRPRHEELIHEPSFIQLKQEIYSLLR